MRLTILGAPRTKKTSQRILVNKRTGKPFVASSAVAKGWAGEAIGQLAQQTVGLATSVYQTKVKGKTVFKRAVWVTPVAVKVLLYRDADRGDLLGYEQAVADALEAAQVLSNDKIIASWDGSRRLIDRKNPRIEITIEPMKE